MLQTAEAEAEEEANSQTAEAIQKRREREAEQWRLAQLKAGTPADVNANFQVLPAAVCLLPAVCQLRLRHVDARPAAEPQLGPFWLATMHSFDSVLSHMQQASSCCSLALMQLQMV